MTPLVQDIDLMIRQNIDGRPIYSNELWRKLLQIGGKLRELGYVERNNQKPNLFSKHVQGDGYIYADLRGNEWEPIWGCPAINLYYYGSVPCFSYIKEIMCLKRNGLELSAWGDPPIAWENPTEEELSQYGSFCHEYDDFGYEEPLHDLDGYCTSCGKDIFPFIRWDELNMPRIHPKFELFYCEDCKQEKYKQRIKRIKKRKFQHDLAHTCRLCGSIIEKPLGHHITYVPEEIMKVCPSCHGIIHCSTFPNYLWKQKRPEPPPKNENKYWCFECGKYHFKNSGIGIDHMEDCKMADLRNQLKLLAERELVYKTRLITHPKEKEWLEEQFKFIEKKKKKLNKELTSL